MFWASLLQCSKLVAEEASADRVGKSYKRCASFIKCFGYFSVSDRAPGGYDRPYTCINQQLDAISKGKEAVAIG